MGELQCPRCGEVAWSGDFPVFEGTLARERAMAEALAILARWVRPGVPLGQLLWVIDQVARALTGDGYEAWREEARPWGDGVEPP